MMVGGPTSTLVKGAGPLAAAARSGIREIILPAQNRNDWEEVPEEVRKKLKIHFIERISELLLALW